MKTPKFIIRNRANLDDIVLMEKVLDVIKMGLISAQESQYCYANMYNSEYLLFFEKTKYGYCITASLYNEER